MPLLCFHVLLLSSLAPPAPLHSSVTAFCVYSSSTVICTPAHVQLQALLMQILCITVQSVAQATKDKYN